MVLVVSRHFEDYGGPQYFDNGVEKIRCIRPVAAGSDQSKERSSAGVRWLRL